MSEQRYTSHRGWFSVDVPRASNWAGVPFTIEDASESGQRNWDLVAFYVKDFGELFIASVRHLSEEILAEMSREDDRTTLSKSSRYALLDLPQSFRTEPAVVADTFVETPYGEALLRVFLAEGGSLLTVVNGEDRRPFDTLIAVMVVKHKNRILWAVAQNDSQPDDREVLEGRIKGFIRGIELNP